MAAESHKKTGTLAWIEEVAGQPCCTAGVLDLKSSAEVLEDEIQARKKWRSTDQIKMRK